MATEVVHVIDPDSGSGTDYTSLNAWEAAQQRDLVAADEIAVAKCRCTGGTADTAFLAVDGWTTDATRYIKIWTDPAESYRHNGTYQTGNKFRMERSGHGPALRQDVRLEGIQVKCNGGDFQAIRIDPPASEGREIYVSHCLAHTGTGSGGYAFDIRNDGNDYYIWNCIALQGYYGFIIRDGADATAIYNCTSVDAGSRNFYATGSGVSALVKNCLAQDGVDEDYTAGSGATWGAASANNLSSDATAPGFGAQHSKTVTFVDKAGGDFHLSKQDGSAKSMGDDLSSDSILSFSDDIDLEDRFGDWDIGADQIVKDEIGGRIHGVINVSNERGGRVHGIANITNERGGYVYGKKFIFVGRGGRVEGTFRANDQRGARIHGIANIVTERGGYVYGRIIITNERGGRIEGVPGATSEAGGRIEGIANIVNERGGRIHGVLNVTNERGGRVEGTFSASAERGGRIWGQGTLTEPITTDLVLVKLTSFSTDLRLVERPTAILGTNVHLSKIFTTFTADLVLIELPTQIVTDVRLVSRQTSTLQADLHLVHRATISTDLVLKLRPESTIDADVMLVRTRHLTTDIRLVRAASLASTATVLKKPYLVRPSGDEGRQDFTPVGESTVWEATGGQDASPAITPGAGTYATISYAETKITTPGLGGVKLLGFAVEDVPVSEQKGTVVGMAIEVITQAFDGSDPLDVNEFELKLEIGGESFSQLYDLIGAGPSGDTPTVRGFTVNRPTGHALNEWWTWAQATAGGKRGHLSATLFMDPIGNPLQPIEQRHFGMTLTVLRFQDIDPGRYAESSGVYAYEIEATTHFADVRSISTDLRLAPQKAIQADMRLVERKTTTVSTDLHLAHRATISTDVRIVSRPTSTLASDAHIVARLTSGVSSDARLVERKTATVSTDLHLVHRATVNTDMHLVHRSTIDADVHLVHREFLVADIHLVIRATADSDLHLVKRAALGASMVLAPSTPIGVVGSNRWNRGGDDFSSGWGF